MILDTGVRNYGHRVHLLGMTLRDLSLGKTHREIGLGLWQRRSNGLTPEPAVINIHTAVRDKNSLNFVTGVVYDDKNKNGR